MSVEKVVVVVAFIERNIVLAGETYLLKLEMYGVGLNLSNLIFFRVENMGARRLKKEI